ncbi:alpha/beta fold hydrolase [Bogoriella caseilytica]|uniref:Pimeloyl-ACP methyl ester carboxylesterase n=1 Tax=Bogoriella caseilytica TaxID=56055 RepID=A0A3N2BAZ6_9MICO|nr:alpha/beta hydrolase [Bogoriella caseilytica]ROR72378.1 pimeloyl-ACP methyl ester carboxylesterase [Bogoriella caseilytica]
MLPATVGLVAGALIFASSAPVGHFRSAAGQTEYLAAYERAIAEGPEVSERLSFETEYGVVRVLRYDATDPGRAEADPLVLLPGTQSGAPMWADNIHSLQATQPVYVLDLLGQPGRSIQSRPIERHEDDARWLAQVLEQLPGDPVVMGHSLGGWIAANLAVHQPEAVSRVIVVDPVMTFGDLSLGAVARSLPASVSWFPQSWREDFASWTANDAPVEDEPIAEMIEAGMQHFALGSPAPTRFDDEQLQEIDIPMLVIMAGQSRMHDSAEAAANAERLLTHGTVVTYDGASHAITGEEPASIAEEVAAFMDN